MTQPLRVQADWNEVTGSITGHIEGLPEITCEGKTPKAFEKNVREVQGQFHLSGRPVEIKYGSPALSLAA